MELGSTFGKKEFMDIFLNYHWQLDLEVDTIKKFGDSHIGDD